MSLLDAVKSLKMVCASAPRWQFCGAAEFFRSLLASPQSRGAAVMAVGSLSVFLLGPLVPRLASVALRRHPRKKCCVQSQPS